MVQSVQLLYSIQQVQIASDVELYLLPGLSNNGHHHSSRLTVEVGWRCLSVGD